MTRNGIKRGPAIAITIVRAGRGGKGEARLRCAESPKNARPYSKIYSRMPASLRQHLKGKEQRVPALPLRPRRPFPELQYLAKQVRLQTGKSL
jgi:hypothetical protein